LNKSAKLHLTLPNLALIKQDLTQLNNRQMNLLYALKVWTLRFFQISTLVNF